jgi:hypothetical protein
MSALPLISGHWSAVFAAAHKAPVPAHSAMSATSPLFPQISDMTVRATNGRNGPLPEVSSPLFHDVVGEREEFIWNGEAQRLGGLEVDDEIKFGRLLDRQRARLRPT